ncbi:MAG TPA: cupin domain-containing protein [Pyrinomonadaceae bacterium]|nr:cupin domain-containing protein [Pyrinomonadaceae bacterium]
MPEYLPQLNEAVAQLIARPETHSLVDSLKKQLPQTSEPFVWSAIDLQSIQTRLPDSIRSCWIFVLKKDVASGCHYHPNSIQHMVMVEGEGSSKVGPDSREMKLFGDPDSSLDDVWYVIPEGMPHEFFPKGQDVVVLSFHTCTSDELEEISCDSGTTRNYDPRF